MKTPKFLLLLVVVSFVVQLKAQVGINTTEINPLASLEIKNIQPQTVPRGLLIPRMSTLQRNLIKMSNDTITNGQGLMIYNTDEDCFNYYDKINAKWQSICGGMSKTVASVDCGDISSFGLYYAGAPTSSSNYLKILFNVTNPGLYTVEGMPEVANGYYFSASGQVLSPGAYTLLIPAIGTPKVAGVDVVDITLNGAPINSTCASINITVDNQSLLYDFDCSQTKVTGTYAVGKALSGNNFITMDLINIDPTAVGSAYDINATVIDDPGFSFRGQGTLGSASTQSVMLYGKGTPTVAQSTTATVTSNSTLAGVVTCTTPINVIDAPGYQIDPASPALTSNTNYLAGNLTNQLTLTLTFSPSDANHTYVIQTDEQNGVSYSGIGVLTTSPQTVTLDAKGAAVNLGLETFAIRCNSSAATNTTGSANVLMANRKLRVLSIGSVTDCSLSQLDQGTGGLSQFIFSTNNFSTTYDPTLGSKMYYQDGWDVKWVSDNFSSADLENYITAYQPDIITIGYRWRNVDGSCGDVISRYLDNSGIVLCLLENGNTQAFLRAVFKGYKVNTTAIDNLLGSVKGSVYQFGSSLQSDPYINGRYGDLDGQYWGDDSGPTVAVSNLPWNTAVYSNGSDVSNNEGRSNIVTAFRMTDKDFFFFGDGGFANAGPGTGYQAGDKQSLPAWFDANFFPVPKPNYGGTNSRQFSVYNSIFFANFMAAAADRARETGFKAGGLR